MSRGSTTRKEMVNIPANKKTALYTNSLSGHIGEAALHMFELNNPRIQDLIGALKGY